MTLGCQGSKGQTARGTRACSEVSSPGFCPKANIQTSKCKDRESENGASCPSSRPEEQTQQKHLPLLQVFQLPLKAGKRSHVRNVFCESVSTGWYLQ